MAGKHGVDACVQVLEAGGELVCDVADLVKGGLGGVFTKLPKVLEVVADLTQLAKAVPDSLPELSELDSDDFSKLGGAAFTVAKKVVAKLKV